MRIAFLSDIHANLEALTACLASARQSRVDRIVFLGDIVGYGADPKACLDLVREHCLAGSLAIRGNHDEAVMTADLSLNSNAAAAVTWTAAALDDDDRAYLAGLPLSIEEDGRLYVHASAKTPEKYPYIHGLQEASESLISTKAQLTACGHVHVPALYHIALTGKVMGFIPISGAPIPLSTRRRWLAVMGAVGQPRDGNPAASYGILDTGRNEIAYMRVPYDVERAAAKIRAAGLPEQLWSRLAAGR